MTCKDCLHYESCMEYTNLKNSDFAQNFNGSDVSCDIFKNKSEWAHLPCKVGDTIFFDTFKRGESIGVQPHKVARVEVVVSTEREFGGVGAEIPDWQFGKTVFLTREEAEKSLEERRNEDAEIHRCQ